jgi:hypothetical protein
MKVKGLYKSGVRVHNWVMNIKDEIDEASMRLDGTYERTPCV